MNVAVADRMFRPTIGHWKLAVFDGDVERAPLEQWQLDDNKRWLEEGLLTLRNGKTFQALHGENLLPIFAGRVVQLPIETLEGYNLVTTSGKGLLLDRLFATGGPPTQCNSCGVGATAAAAAVGDVQLGSTPTIKAFDLLPTRAGLVVTCVTTFGTGDANISWNEMAMFNGVINGTSTLLNRIAPIGPFAKGPTVSIVATVTLTQG